jgi:hypothetical protein
VESSATTVDAVVTTIRITECEAERVGVSILRRLVRGAAGMSRTVTGIVSTLKRVTWKGTLKFCALTVIASRLVDCCLTLFARKSGPISHKDGWVNRGH